jgi:hypothetical protein
MKLLFPPLKSSPISLLTLVDKFHKVFFQFQNILELNLAFLIPLFWDLYSWPKKIVGILVVFMYYFSIQIYIKFSSQLLTTHDKMRIFWGWNSNLIFNLYLLVSSLHYAWLRVSYFVLSSYLRWHKFDSIAHTFL